MSPRKRSSTKRKNNRVTVLPNRRSKGFRKRSAAARKGWETRRAKVDYIVTTRYSWTEADKRGHARQRSESVDWVVPFKKNADEDDVMKALRDVRESQIRNDSDIEISKIMGHLGKVFNAVTRGDMLEINPHAGIDVVRGSSHEYKKITARDYVRTK